MGKIPQPQEIWNYVYSDKSITSYIIVSIGEMKLLDGEWIDCVTYQSTVNGLIYTRDRGTFLSKFRFVPKESNSVN